LRFLAATLLLLAPPAPALTPAGQEFVEVLKKLEPVHCEKRKLRRAIVLAEAENRQSEARELRARFDALNRDRRTAQLEKRLAELEKLVSDGRGGARDPQDLDAISFQNRIAFYRCD
jgi:hypothetical protein